MAATQEPHQLSEETLRLAEFARAILAQFEKMKRIEFRKYGESEKIHTQIAFYEDKDIGNIVGRTVDKNFLESIIEFRKLGLSDVHTHYYLNEEPCDLGKLANINSLAVFSALFLGKDIDVPNPMEQADNLCIEKLVVKEPVENIKNNMEALLALDSAELVFYSWTSNNLIFDCSQYSSSPVVARNTKKVLVQCVVLLEEVMPLLDQFAAELKSFGLFLIRCCPNLTKLHFHFNSTAQSADEEFCNNMFFVLKLLESDFLVPLEAGTPELSVHIYWMGDCRTKRDETFSHLHLFTETFRIEHSEHPSEYKVKRLVTDTKGRAHRCGFQLMHEESSVALTLQDDSGNDDDDDNETGADNDVDNDDVKGIDDNETGADNVVDNDDVNGIDDNEPEANNHVDEN